jgi:hypothetical protein
MKDPCDICLVKVNCTQVCPPKKNYQVLLRNAIKENTGGRYFHYVDLHRNSTLDEANIVGRAIRLKNNV